MYRNGLKRIIDFILSFIGLIVLSPAYLIIAILVRTKLGSPVLFRQQRPGKDEKIFTMYKFRTMTSAVDLEGNLLPDADRLTKFGKFLRSTSLDELPELINILKGDMAIVGPRPLLVEYLPYYTEDERHRHDVRPGLTGLAQVNGRNAVAWEERFQHDIQYVKNISFLGDLKVVYRTVLVTLKRKDILVGTENVILDLNKERGVFIED